MQTRHRAEVTNALTKIAVHTGKDPEEFVPEDLVAFRAWYVSRQGRTKCGSHGAWEALVAVGILPAGSSLRQALRRGQRPTAELVDRYQIKCRPVRDLLVRYLDERRPGPDYRTFRTMVGMLARKFWADLEAHHPGIDSIDLPPDVALAWKERLRTVVRHRPRPEELRGRAHARPVVLSGPGGMGLGRSVRGALGRSQPGPRR
ncbi:hypothetical protein [Actinomadura chokoriensis]|uniref:hypothetical protein n=1 Tax=Actinomadura chokoriensis TaxID=454156 RepID=UPI0031F8EE8A